MRFQQLTHLKIVDEEEVLTMSDRPMTESVRPGGVSGEEYDRLSEKHRRCEERLSELRDRLFLSEQE